MKNTLACGLYGPWVKKIPHMEPVYFNTGHPRV